MYAFLTGRIGHKLASVATGLWFALVLLVLLLFGGTPETTLRYINF